MLARAFVDDAALSFICPDAAVRATKLPQLFGLFLASDRLAGPCRRTAGGEAAALWRCPGRVRPGWTERLRRAPALGRLFGAALPRALALDAGIGRNLPAEAAIYLHVLGCEPAMQGRGLGARLMAEGVAQVDAAGLPCLLETASE